MGNFKHGGGKRFGGNHGGRFERQETGRPVFGQNSWNKQGDRDRGSVVMHPATCAKCGSACEVPFRPFAGRQIFCTDCFQGKKNDDGRGNDRYEQKGFGGNKNFAHPDFRNNPGRENNDDIKRQLEILSSKIERLTRAVEAMSGGAPMVEKENTAPVEIITVEAPTFKMKKRVSKKRKSK